MSVIRQTQIMEEEMVKGWTAELVTAVGAEVVGVKAAAGKVAKIIVNTDVITVTPKDGATAVWAALTDNVGLDLVNAPMQFNTSINLDFSGAGTAWILYK